MQSLFLAQSLLSLGVRKGLAMKKILPILAFVLLGAPLPLASAHAQTTTTRDHRTNKTTTIRDHRVGAVQLTKGECTQLGGDVKDASKSLCPSAEYCRRVGANGKIYRVCISPAETATTGGSSGSSGGGTSTKITRPKTGTTIFLPPSRVFNSQLTEEECKGLGGVVRPSTECGVVNSTCVTVDQHGVIRTACINKLTN